MDTFMIDMIRNDFNVEVIAQNEPNCLLLGIRGTHYHFVEYVKEGQFSSIYQHHIPRYSMAYWFDSLVTNGKATSIRPLSAPLLQQFQLTFFPDNQTGFSSNTDYIIPENLTGQFLKAVKKDISRLKRARKLVKTENGSTFLEEITSLRNNPFEVGILNEDDLVIVAYDFLLYRSLRKKQPSILHYMYSQLIDGDESIPDENIRKMAAWLTAIDPGEVQDADLKLFLDIQEKNFPKKIWGDQVKINREEAADVIRDVYNNLGLVRQAQFKTLYFLHGTFVFLLFGYIFQSISLPKYIELCTVGHQPDSTWEQKVRYESAVVQIFQDAFHTRN